MKKPFVTFEKLQEIVSSCPTPFHLYDEAGIRKTIRDLRAAFSWNPGFREFYAVKACPNPAILSIFREEGCGLDCASKTELIMAKALGFTDGRAVFSSNDTLPGEFSFALSAGALINFDDITMIPYFEREAGTFPETVCCRYNPGGTYEVSNGIMDNPGEAKYGMTEAQLEEAFTYLSGKGVKHFGIHAFLVSNALGNEYYPMLARTLFELAVRLRKKTGVHISFIDLSGGIGIAYRPEDETPDIAAVGEGVRKAYEEILAPEGMDDIAIGTELGRFMTGPHGALIATAIHEKHIAKEYIGLDACAANLMRPAIYGAYHHITVMGKEEEPCDHLYDVTGSLCENSDKFAVNRMLPRIDIGDIIYIHDTGAHGYSMGYNYNGKLRSAEILLREDGSFEEIRRAETPEDYFATFDRMPVYIALRKAADEEYDAEEVMRRIREMLPEDETERDE